MKNLTISMEEDLLRWARIEAAKGDVSVSRFIREMLAERRDAESGYDAAMSAFLSRHPYSLDSRGRLPRRDELYGERLSRYGRKRP